MVLYVYSVLTRNIENSPIKKNISGSKYAWRNYFTIGILKK